MVIDCTIGVSGFHPSHQRCEPATAQASFVVDNGTATTATTLVVISVRATISLIPQSELDVVFIVPQERLSIKLLI